MTSETILVTISVILFLSICGQFLAWRLNLPAILFLLLFGFIAGPVSGYINPDNVFGSLLMPTVSILVAVILFEGGLSLRLRGIRETGNVVMKLLTVGLAATWVLVSILAYFVLKLDIKLCILLGAILTVTGPTVIGPLLRHIQPDDRVNNILKWEGIIIDPIGALLVFLTFETIFIQGLNKSVLLILFGIIKTIFMASCLGSLAALLLIIVMAKYWIPDRFHGIFALMLVTGVFTLSNMFQPESGLWAVTIMGIVLANQQRVSITHIEEFKENLRILFVSTLFVVLGARFSISNLKYFNAEMVIFIIFLFLLVRPASVFLATARTSIPWKEKVFMSWMAPRGIVAAAVASIFAGYLRDIGYPQTEYWESVVFSVIIFTVLVYGISSKPLAVKLGIANSDPQGVLIIGAHSWARIIAKEMTGAGIKVIMIDTNQTNVSRALKEKLYAIQGNVLTENFFYDLPLNGIGYLMALTSNDEANSLVALNSIKTFGRAKVFQIHPDVGEGEDKNVYAKHLRGRLLFSRDSNYGYLARKINSLGAIKNLMFTNKESSDAFEKEPHAAITPLFIIDQKQRLHIFTTDQKLSPKAGDLLFYLEGE